MRREWREPLYRKVNTKARGVRHGHGGDYRHDRNTKAEQASIELRGRMQGRSDRGLDYTPLFRFLLSSVGKPWDEVHREAVSRLDREEPIYWIVALQEADRMPHVRIGESSFFSGLYVDAAGLLQLVDPAVTVETMSPDCPCCTHTFNGVPFAKQYEG